MADLAQFEALLFTLAAVAALAGSGGRPRWLPLLLAIAFGTLALSDWSSVPAPASPSPASQGRLVVALLAPPLAWLAGRTSARLDRAKERIAALVEEQRAAARHAEASFLRLSHLARVAPVGLLEADPPGRITYITLRAAQLLGISREAALGDGWLASLPRSERERAAERWSSGISSGRAFELDLCLDPEQGEDGERWLALRLEPRLTEGGGWTGTLSDLTDRRRQEGERARLERRVQAAEKLESLGVLAGGLAHDFNNLLVAILGGVDLLEHGLAPDAPERRHLERIRAGAARAAELVQHMLAFAGGASPGREPVDLPLLARETAEIVGGTVRVEVEDQLPAVSGDRVQLGQILLNLIANAREAYGGMDGEVRVHLSAREIGRGSLGPAAHEDALRPGACVVLEVEDRGAGMAPEVAGRMFEPFFTTKLSGRGLGLAAVIGIVRTHHGAIAVETWLGEGTTVRVALPAARAPGVEPAPARRTDRRATGLLLLVDDDLAVLETTRLLLTVHGFEVLPAPNGALALELFRELGDEVALALLDVRMPGMDGPALLRELHRLQPRLPALFFSGQGAGEARARGLAPDAPFLAKPFREAELLARVEQLLATSPGRES